MSTKNKSKKVSLLIVLAIGLLFNVHTLSAQAADSKDPKPCQEAEHIQLLLTTLGDSQLTGKLTVLQTECEALKTRATEWQKPCDPRANLPITFEYDAMEKITDPTTPRDEIQLGDIALIELSPEQHQAQCKAATIMRCYWAPTPGYGLPDEHNGYMSIADSPRDGITQPKTPQLDHEGKPISYYMRGWELHCPDKKAMALDPDILSGYAIETISVDEYNRRMNATSDGGARQRAIQASLRLNLPKPDPHITWLWNGNQPYTLVNGPTWYATTPATYTNRISYTKAGNTWVQVTATPTGLSLAANNEPEHWCTGPGQTPTHITTLTNQGTRPLWHNSPDGCSTRFTTTSPGLPDQPVTGTMRTRWAITYTANNNTTGTLPDMYTQTPTTAFAITEAQTLITK